MQVLSWASLASRVTIAPLGLPTTSPSPVRLGLLGPVRDSHLQINVLFVPLGVIVQAGLLLPLYVSQGHMNPAQELDHLVNLANLAMLAHTPA
jgi:hypothetical protein